MSKISVLIVTYNYEQYLKECLESVLSQECQAELEVILVDDGSLDGTRNLVQEFPDIKYIYQEHQGVAAARNRALREASGDYIAFLDADDMWKKEKLNIQLEYLEAHSDCQIVFTAYENFLEQGVFAEEPWVRRCISFSKRDQNCLPTALFRKELYYRIGGFSTELERGEDTEWVSRFRMQEIHSAYIEQSLYLRRLHGNNLTQKSEKDNKKETIKKQMEVMQKSIRNSGKRTNFLENGISVIIPVWNGETYIKECIESVQRQHNDLPEVPMEIIVADDGSSDSTVLIAKECGAVVYEMPHKGTAAAKNAGMIKANYQYIFFLDADDRLAEGALKALYTVFTEKTMLQVVFSYARDFYTYKSAENDCKEQIGQRVYSGCLPGCALIRKSVFRKVGLFNENLQTGETVDWMARFRDSGLESELIETVTLERRIHEKNTGRVQRSQEQQDYARILRERLRRKKETRAEN